MKKIAYIAPEVEIVKLDTTTTLMVVSEGTEPSYGGAGNPDENQPD